MIIPCNTKEFHWTEAEGKRGSFRPTGRLEIVGALDDNPVRRRGKEPIWSARYFVGLNVGGVPTWSVDDVVRVVRSKRESQGQSADASFIVQKGIYTSDRTGEVVEEDSVQIIVLNFGEREPFERDMIDLAETLARELRQELVILEIQRGGVTQETLEIVP